MGFIGNIIDSANTKISVRKGKEYQKEYEKYIPLIDEIIAEKLLPKFEELTSYELEYYLEKMGLNYEDLDEELDSTPEEEWKNEEENTYAFFPYYFSQKDMGDDEFDELMDKLDELDEIDNPKLAEIKKNLKETDDSLFESIVIKKNLELNRKQFSDLTDYRAHLLLNKKIKQVIKDGKNIENIIKNYVEYYQDRSVESVKFEALFDYLENNNLKDSDGHIFHAKRDQVAELIAKEMYRQRRNNRLNAEEERQQTLPYRLKNAIKEFVPSYRWEKEQGYHGELTGYLKREFPNLEIELARSSTRPDIVVEDIAIEIKGPTTAEGLGTLASKCLRYSKHFPKGVLIVLFDIQSTPRMTTDIVESIHETFPNVVVIRGKSP